MAHNYIEFKDNKELLIHIQPASAFLLFTVVEAYGLFSFSQESKNVCKLYQILDQNFTQEIPQVFLIASEASPPNWAANNNKIPFAPGQIARI